MCTAWYIREGMEDDEFSDAHVREDLWLLVKLKALAIIKEISELQSDHDQFRFLSYVVTRTWSL